MIPGNFTYVFTNYIDFVIKIDEIDNELKLEYYKLL
jgi:hypothetical protein